MKTLLIIAAVVTVLLLAKRLMAGPSLSPAEADKLVASGDAVLVDVREPSEWSAGVAAPAFLLPLSDLRGAREFWKPVLEKNRGKKFILYCASGARSGIAAGLLRQEGFDAINGGGFGGWRAAGLPVRNPH